MDSDQSFLKTSSEVVFEAIHCTVRIRRPGAGTVLIIIQGADIGELGDKPFRELEKDFAPGLPIELFIDARNVPGASLNVSNDWAQWMLAHRTQLHRVNILCGSKLVEVTAQFVRRFTDFRERMRIFTDAEKFEQALATTTSFYNC